MAFGKRRNWIIGETEEEEEEGKKLEYTHRHTVVARSRPAIWVWPENT